MLALAALVSGCVQSALEADFGNSARQQVLAQQAHPDISANPDPDAPDSTDAARVQTAVQTYRADPTREDDDAQEPIIVLESNR